MYIFRKDDLITFNTHEMNRTDPANIKILIRELSRAEVDEEWPEEAGRMWMIQSIDRIHPPFVCAERFFDFLQRGEFWDHRKENYLLHLERLEDIFVDPSIIDDEAVTAAEKLMKKYTSEEERKYLVAELLQMVYS